VKQRSARPADASSCRPALGGLPPRSTATRVSIREVNYALGRRRRTARRRGARMIPGARPLIRQRAYGAMWSQPDADHNCASAEASRRLVGERARMNSSIYRRASERDKRTGRSLARWLFIDTTPRRPRLARSCSALSITRQIHLTVTDLSLVVPAYASGVFNGTILPTDVVIYLCLYFCDTATHGPGKVMKK